VNPFPRRGPFKCNKMHCLLPTVLQTLMWWAQPRVRVSTWVCQPPRALSRYLLPAPSAVLASRDLDLLDACWQPAWIRKETRYSHDLQMVHPSVAMCLLGIAKRTGAGVKPLLGAATKPQVHQLLDLKRQMPSFIWFSATDT